MVGTCNSWLIIFSQKSLFFSPTIFFSQQFAPGFRLVGTRGIHVDLMGCHVCSGCQACFLRRNIHTRSPPFSAITGVDRPPTPLQPTASLCANAPPEESRYNKSRCRRIMNTSPPPEVGTMACTRQLHIAKFPAREGIASFLLSCTRSAPPAVHGVSVRPVIDCPPAFGLTCTIFCCCFLKSFYILKHVLRCIPPVS